MPVNWSVCPSVSLLSIHPVFKINFVSVSRLGGVERGRSVGGGCMLLPTCTQHCCDPTLLVFHSSINKDNCSKSCANCESECLYTGVFVYRGVAY